MASRVFSTGGGRREGACNPRWQSADRGEEVWGWRGRRVFSRRLRVEESESGRIKKKKKKEKGKKKEKSLLQAAFRCLTLSLALRCIQLQWISNLVRSARSVLRLANKVAKSPEWEACVGGRQFIYRLYHRAWASFVVFFYFFYKDALI